MGRPIKDSETELIKNGPFYNSNYWAPVPPWVIAGGKAIWQFDAFSEPNNLSQTIYAGADETYLCHFRAIVTAPGRGFSFDVSDARQIYNTGTGVYDETFELTPTIPGNFECRVGIVFGPGSTLSIWNISVIGTPVGDPVYDIVNVKNLRPMKICQSEYADLGGGEEMFRLAGVSDSSNCLIKVEK